MSMLLFGWLVVAVPGIPVAVMVGRELGAEAVFAVWSWRHLRARDAIPRPKPLPPAQGLVIDGEVVAHIVDGELVPMEP